MRSVDVDELDIDSHDLFFGSLLVNGVDVVPLVDAELNRQFPGRELPTARTPEGLREGWVAVQCAWRTTVASTPPDLVDAHVDDEVLEVRAERQRLGSDFLAAATAGLLAEEREDPWGGGDRRPGVRDCIRVILEEEWAHLRYVRRDLAHLRAVQPQPRS